MLAVCETFAQHFGSRFIDEKEVPVSKMVEVLQKLGVFEQDAIEPRTIHVGFMDGREMSLKLHPHDSTVHDLKKLLTKDIGVPKHQMHIYTCTSPDGTEDAPKGFLPNHVILADATRVMVLLDFEAPAHHEATVTLQEGEFYDIRDERGVWSEAMVERVVGDCAHVQFLFVHLNQLIHVPVTSKRAAPLRTHTFRGHQNPNFQVGQRIDVLSREGVWEKGVIKHMTNARVYVKYYCSHDNRIYKEWIDMSSRCTACFGKHTEPVLFNEYELFALF
jgi:hypothetical protein